MVLRNLSRFSFKGLNTNKCYSTRQFSSLNQDQKTTAVPKGFERSLGKVNEKMDQEVANLSSRLDKIIGGKAHPGYFSSIYVYTFMEWVPLHTAARVTKSSDTELIVESFDPSNAPLIEKALEKSGLKLNITRDFGVIYVKLLDDNKSSALEEISVQVSHARKAVEDVQHVASYNLKDFPHQLRKLEYLTSLKLAAIEELGEMHRAEL